VLFRHVLPNIGPLIIVQGSVMFASAILIEASLSYLGVGAQRPTPSWGRLLNEALPLIDKAVITADEQLSERLAALYRDHRRELEAPIAFLFVSLILPIIAASATLWWLLG